ncbi:MAG: VTT domain-containing protein [Pseudolabrys sp.]
MLVSPPKAQSPGQPRRLIGRLAPLIVVVILAAIVYFASGHGEFSLDSLIGHRAAVDAFVAERPLIAILAYIALYIVAVALSVPGAWFLTVSGGFLFGLVIGISAAVIGATLGATLIFLIARTALGEPLLKRAGPRAKQLALGFREDAFSYLLFLRLVPAFPFFLVNLVPAFAGVRLLTFVTATALGVIPGAAVFAFFGTGLDSVIAEQQAAHSACLAARRADCAYTFGLKDVLKPDFIAAFVVLGVLALVPVLVKRWRARKRAIL